MRAPPGRRLYIDTAYLSISIETRAKFAECIKQSGCGFAANTTLSVCSKNSKFFGKKSIIFFNTCSRYFPLMHLPNRLPFFPRARSRLGAAYPRRTRVPLVPRERDGALVTGPRSTVDATKTCLLFCPKYTPFVPSSPISYLLHTSASNRPKRAQFSF